MDIWKAVQEWLEANPPVEDPLVRDILVKKDYKLEVSGKCTATLGDYGRIFYTSLKYDIVDNKIKIYK